MRALLEAAGLPYEIDPTLVRGLDYYTRTVFEFESERLGAQAALGGGGRYDGLIEELGGPPTPGVGWAAGVERMLLAAGEAGRDRGTPTCSWPAPTAGTTRSLLARRLRNGGLRDRDGAGRPVA